MNGSLNELLPWSSLTKMCLLWLNSTMMCKAGINAGMSCREVWGCILIELRDVRDVNVIRHGLGLDLQLSYYGWH